MLNKSRIDKEGRQCTICGKYKKWEEYYGDKGARTKRISFCIPCHKQKKKDTYRAKNQIIANDIDLSTSIELDFLLDLNAWTADEIKTLLLTVKKFTAMPYRMKPRDIYRKYIPARSTIECAKVLTEFKQVAAHGIKFDDYMKGERKFRKDGKKILAKQPK